MLNQDLTQHYQGQIRELFPDDEQADRLAAFAQFAEQGFPNKQQEAWRYTPAQALFKKAWPLADTLEYLDIAGALPESIQAEIRPTSSASTLHLSTALAPKHYAFEVTDTPDEAWHATLSSQAGTLANLSVDLTLKANQTFNWIIDTQLEPDSFLNAAMNVSLEANATLNVFCLNDDQQNASLVADWQCHLEQGAKLNWLNLKTGLDLCRHALHVHLNGEHAHLNAYALDLSNHKQVHDTSIEAFHNAPNTRSDQTQRALINGQARSVFLSHAKVDNAAPGSVTEQHAKALLLSPKAKSFCKPTLEILNSQVMCQHGATVGDIESDALFYLLSRGLSRDQAQRALLNAFIAPIVDAWYEFAESPDIEALIEQRLST